MVIRPLKPDEVNLIVSERDVSSMLATIVLKGLIGRKPVDFLWVANYEYSDENLSALLGRKERVVACVGFGPNPHCNGRDPLIQTLNTENHQIAAICDVHGRSLWAMQVQSFSQLFLQPRNSDSYFTCPGRLLLNAFADDIEGYEHELCELSHYAAIGELRGFAKTIASITSPDPRMDWRRNSLVNHFAFNRNPNPQIQGWIDEARTMEKV